MSLLEETYRQIDPEGEVNLAFDDADIKESFKKQQIGISPMKNGTHILDV